MDAGAELLEAPDPELMATRASEADLVIPSPGVRPDHPAIVAATVAGVPVRSEVDVAVERLRARTPPPCLVAVTGTNGKTTVTTMIARCARRPASAARRWATSDARSSRPPEDEADVVVAEVSTFQLEFTTDAFVPDVAVLLNVAQDHIDWHDTVEDYAAAKARVFAHQGPGDVLIVNHDDPVAWDLARSARAQVVPYTRGEPEPGGYGVADGMLVGPEGVLAPVPASGAAHDVDNGLAAAAASLRAGADVSAVARTLAGWTGLPHRVQFVGDVDGVQYVDDSKATNGHAAASALEGFEHVVLIAGGRDRSRDLGLLRKFAPRLRAVVAIGEATDTVVAVFDGLVPVERATSMHRAVRTAASRAQTGDTVLLSPGCAPLDWYPDYEARGDDFAREVVDLALDVEGAGTSTRRRARSRARASPEAERPRPHAREAATARTEPTEGAEAQVAVAVTSTATLLVATVAVLNLVGVVMVLSASSVASLTDYGSPWYFFLRTCSGPCSASRVRVRAALRLPRLAAMDPAAGPPQRRAAVRSARPRRRRARRGLAALDRRRDAALPADRAGEARAAALRGRSRGASGGGGPRLAPRRAADRPRPRGFRRAGDEGARHGLGVGARPRRGRGARRGGSRSSPPARRWPPPVRALTLLAIVEPYRRARMLTFLHPFADSTNAGYQIAQSLIAIGSGGLTGVGLGAGRAKWNFLPNAHTDFIFAIIGEELGLIGCAVVLSLFAVFGFLGMRAALHAPDRFGTLLAAGTTAWIVGQAVINVGAVVGLLPVTGISSVVRVVRGHRARHHDVRGGDPGERRARRTPAGCHARP